MPTPRTDTHQQIIDLMGDKAWFEVDLCAALNKPIYGVRSTLRAMIRRKEVRVIKPKVQPAPFKYKLRGK